MGFILKLIPIKIRNIFLNTKFLIEIEFLKDKGCFFVFVHARIAHSKSKVIHTANHKLARQTFRML